MENMRTDAILMEILIERKTVTGFLDSVFGFLRRNTDFYHLKTNSAEQIGFPKGMKEQILFGAMQRYDPDCVTNPLATEDDGDCVPPAVEEVEIEIEKQISSDGVMNIPANGNAIAATFNVPSPRLSEVSTEANFTVGDYANGSCFEKYCWSQTLKDIELHVLLPEELRSSRTLSITIQASRIKVCSKNSPFVVVLEGSLSNKCKQKDFVWTIAEGKLLISLDKIKEMWWEKLFDNEPSIDVKKINCERYIDELPEESQAAIEKLRIDQLNKDRTVQDANSQDENETLARLRKAWDIEGSPFRGQPFDPTMVQFK